MYALFFKTRQTGEWQIYSKRSRDPYELEAIASEKFADQKWPQAKIICFFTKSALGKDLLAVAGNLLNDLVCEDDGDSGMMITHHYCCQD